MIFLLGLLEFFAPILAGFGLFWAAGKARGKNARRALNFAAWGSWLLMLWFVPIALFPFPLGFLNLILALTPAAVCFLLAANSLLKEMRAQRVGDYTDAA